ncbi:MAG: glycoside hydrolase family 10 protein [Marinifilaceae bacterium]
MKLSLTLSVCLLTFFSSLGLGQSPKREFRGAWIQTVFQSEYASMTPQQMQADFITKLNKLEACGINALIFQVRPEADAWYHSSYEPWSRFCTGLQGKAPSGGFDPMAFLIQECHKRNIEFHAWLNPYRAGTSGIANLCTDHIYHKHPERFVIYNKQLLFNPGVPENSDYICKIVADIVSRYDVDAIHMDDYFYPYPAKGEQFPDTDTFLKYGLAQGYADHQRNDWRRNNVNQLVRSIKETIVEIKPWVRFGISPFGIYRNKVSTPDGSGSDTRGLQNYDDLYADINLWTENGWIDYNMPQLYWEMGYKIADYEELIYWWNKNANGIPLYIGQSVERTMKARDLTDKMKLARDLTNVSGNCFWPANELFWNRGGIVDSLQGNYHVKPALIPAYEHMCKQRPAKVKKIRLQYNIDGYNLRWHAKQSGDVSDDARYFAIYRFRKGEKIDVNNADKLIGTSRYSIFPITDINSGDYYYVITALNRYHQESKPHKLKVRVK